MERQEVKEKRQLVITRKAKKATIPSETVSMPNVTDNGPEIQHEIQNETSRFIQNRLKLDKSILLVDTSYWVYYRFFALRNWYKNANPTIDTSSETFNWLEDKQFMAKYEKLFLDSLYTITVKYNVPMCNIVFCIDCPYKEIWRYELNADYKGTRLDTHKRNNFNSFDIFNVVKDVIIPKLQAKYKLSSIMVSKCEADDVVGNLAPFLESKLIHVSSTSNSEQQVIIVNNNGDDNDDDNEKAEAVKFDKVTSSTLSIPKVYILASDNDYIQICNDNIILIDGLGKQLCFEKKMKGGEHYLIRKILTGDVSDNIEACYISNEYLKSLDPSKQAKGKEKSKSKEKSISKDDEYKKCTPAVITKMVENIESYSKLVTILKNLRHNKMINCSDETICDFIKENQFVKNATIMDFKMIPNDLESNLHDKFNKLV